MFDQTSVESVAASGDGVVPAWLKLHGEMKSATRVDGEPGRKQATLSDRKGKRIIARHHHRCGVPGCRAARNLDVHHIVHQEDGGGHEDWNLLALCAGHHRAHHRGELAIEGRAPEAIRFEFVRSFDESRAHVGTNGNPGSSF